MQLECKDLKFQYPGTSIHVFKALSFQVQGPGFHALFGPSGVGKTTLARMICGKMNGFNGEIATNAMKRILYTYNLERLPGWSSVREHLELNTPDSNKSIVAELIDSFGIEALMESRFAQLSLGQQNRTNLTRYLLQNFDLLIMDESLANVDELTKEKIIPIVAFCTYPITWLKWQNSVIKSLCCAVIIKFLKQLRSAAKII
jgi:ABC-type nitrate/sulfonate/bicarbonate transport system ATPase subunit